MLSTSCLLSTCFFSAGTAVDSNDPLPCAADGSGNGASALRVELIGALTFSAADLFVS